ncbi:MAG: hypothetical protein VX723_02790, partial [Candidatus Thermoplasmatota archaeon]|nr:hypothetical protein [Candidatus Thermoplasmatota archaeon]
MSDDEMPWRPAGMAQVESDEEAPPGFIALRFAEIGIMARMIEPETLNGPEDWESMIGNLESWGEVPEPGSINSLRTIPTPRGLNAVLEADSVWLAEFLPWVSDGRIRARAKAAPEGSRVPIGGYSFEGRDVVILRPFEEKSDDSATIILKALESDDGEAAQRELRNAGMVLGRYHSEAKSARLTPSDQSRWNNRNQWLEETLRATFLWRAPFSKDQPCTLSLMDVRFSDVSGDSLRIGRSRLADALCVPQCEFPAMRDLSSLIHDLSRLLYESSSNLELMPLRLALIEGWKSTAPADWTSKDAFYSHRGGLAIWEYEQCLLDVLEATSHQSGAPQPAVEILRYVQSYQKRMFSNRTLGALSGMAAFFGAASLFRSLPRTIEDVLLPLLFISASELLMWVYLGMSPP